MNKIAMLFCAAFCALSCSSPRPNEVGVDHESLLVDLDACMDDIACHTSKVVRFDFVTPGQHALLLPPGEEIKAPILRPSKTAKLLYVVFAMGAPGGEAIDVTVDGFPVQHVSPAIGTSRTEVELQAPGQATVVPGDYLHVVNNAKDPFELIWVVGRWAD